MLASLKEGIERAIAPPHEAPRRAVVTAQGIMSQDLLVLNPDQPLHEAIDLLVSRGVSGAPVVDKGYKLVGVLSELDCMKPMASSVFHQEGTADLLKVGEVMSREVRTVDPSTDLYTIVHRLVRHRIRRLLVVQGDVLIGLVSRRDVLRAIRTSKKRPSTRV